MRGKRLAHSAFSQAIAAVLTAFLIACVFCASASSADEKQPAAQGSKVGKAADAPAVPAAPGSFENEPAFDATPAPAGGKGGRVTPVEWKAFLGFFLWTGAIILSIFGCLMLIRKVFPKTRNLFPSDAIKILARRPLNANNTLFLVHVGTHIIQVGAGKDSMVSLGEVTDRAEVDLILSQCAGAKGSVTHSFKDALKTNIRESEGKPPEAGPGGKAENVKSEIASIKDMITSWRK
jgi:flagellar biogenesis protein FliO